MDARLKQRLIGAFVLLAVIVIVVPMFFSGHDQRSGTTSVSLGIPAQPQPPLQSKTFALGAPAPAASQAAAAAATSAQSGAKGQFATVTIPGAPAQSGSVGLPRPAPNMPAAVAQSAPAASATAKSPTTLTAVAPQPQAPASKQTARMSAMSPKLATPPAMLPAGTAVQGGYIVSLGAYADAANARALAARVRKLGVKVGEQPMQLHGKPALRIYAGPYSNRALAESARLKIHAAEPRTTAVLVADNTSLATDQPATALPAGKPGGWVVQLGAFDTLVAANGLKDRARTAGFPAYVDSIRTAEGTLWRVRVGPEASRDAAMALRAQLKEKLNQDGIVAVAR